MTWWRNRWVHMLPPRNLGKLTYFSFLLITTFFNLWSAGSGDEFILNFTFCSWLSISFSFAFMLRNQFFACNPFSLFILSVLLLSQSVPVTYMYPISQSCPWACPVSLNLIRYVSHSFSCLFLYASSSLSLPSVYICSSVWNSYFAFKILLSFTPLPFSLSSCPPFSLLSLQRVIGVHISSSLWIKLHWSQILHCVRPKRPSWYGTYIQDFVRTWSSKELEPFE